MPVCMDECDVEGIPSHLDRKSRGAVNPLPPGDRLYLWHQPLPGPDEPYGFDSPLDVPLRGEKDWDGVIPGLRSANQSVISHERNLPDGSPCDVLYHPTRGHLKGMQVACICLDQLRTKTFPHPTIVIHDSKGQPVPSGSDFSFDADHVPERCMYPHCEIRLKFQGKDKKSVGSEEIAMAVSRIMARLAEANRLEMLEQMKAEGVSPFL